jgi:hypothetical protein
MERMTGKTMDAYVEFCTFEDASKAVEKHQRNYREGRPSHIGQRIVTVSLASQAELMQDLFPLAAGVTWNGVNPVFHPVNEHEPWKNFKGFVSEEEMTMLAKHAKVPNRVSAVVSYAEDLTDHCLDRHLSLEHALNAPTSASSAPSKSSLGT